MGIFPKNWSDKQWEDSFQYRVGRKPSSQKELNKYKFVYLRVNNPELVTLKFV